MTDDATEAELLRRLKATPELFERIANEIGSELSIQDRLRQRFDPELVRAALTLNRLREKASTRFSKASQMWFDATGLEQATTEAVASHKAQRFHGRVHDWCCGIGADTIALAEAGCQVDAVDISEAACLRTWFNCELYGVSDRVTLRRDDVEALPDRDGLLHIDPDRRPGGHQRMRRIEDCVPGYDFLRRAIAEFPGGAVKLSPASNFGGKFGDCEIELVSLNGECREATVWFGELAGDDPFRATSLPTGETLAADPLSAWTNVGDLGAWLFDPDPAIVRAGLVDVLAERLGLRRLDEAEEYLTGDALVDSPFVRAFAVVENLPNNQKEIRRAVRRHDAGQIEIKCRHVPIDVESMRRKLPLDGGESLTLIFTRQQGRTKAVLCRRPDSGDSDEL